MPLIKRDTLTLTSWQLRAFEVGGMRKAGLTSPQIAKAMKLTTAYVEKLYDMYEALPYFPSILGISNILKAKTELDRLKYDAKIKTIRETT